MAYQHGETEQIERLYDRYGAVLLLFASALVGDRAMAQDAVHQVFLNLIENGGITHAVNERAFLFACVRNAVLNDQKLRRRETTFEVDSAWFEPPKRDYVEEKKLSHALSSLPREQREVIILHLWGELTFSEIAELLRLSTSTAASRYRYALTKLRGLMATKENTCAQSR